MSRRLAQILSVVSVIVVVVLGLILISADCEGVMVVVFVVYIPIAMVLNYFQRCPHCGAWPRKGSLFHEYCPRCGGNLYDE